MQLSRRMAAVTTWCVAPARQNFAGLALLHGNHMVLVGITVIGSMKRIPSQQGMLKRSVLLLLITGISINYTEITFSSGKVFVLLQQIHESPQKFENGAQTLRYGPSKNV